MHWKLKSLIQNAISLLPSNTSYAAYYWVQRQFGGLKSINPTSRLLGGIETWTLLQSQGQNPYDKTFLEIGTGRIPLTPIAYWLMGAQQIYTVDINPYVREELLQDSIQYMARHRDEIQTLFGEKLIQERFETLLEATESAISLGDILALCQIEYRAPCDAANTGLPAASIDFHTSYNVFEHIPTATLRDILKEGNRITKPSGMFAHRIDYSDHFSHTDSSITAINFLQYSDAHWQRYAGNRYMYMNRLRHDDFIDLYQNVDHHILMVQPETDTRASQQLQHNFEVDQKFSSKSQDILAITKSWFLSRQKKLGQQELVAPH